MILWINGAFGSGKTHTAAELNRRIPGSCVYDPESVGFWLRQNEPEALQADNFQSEPLWRTVNRDMLRHLARAYDGVILVPMTLVEPLYYREILLPLREEGIDVRHVLLYPSRDELKKRLASRFEGKNSWAWKQADGCYRAFEDPIFENRLENDGMSIPETAEAVAALTGLTLSPREGKLRSALRNLGTTLRAIRK